MRLESVIDCETTDFYPFQADTNIVFAETIKAIIDDCTNKKFSNLGEIPQHNCPGNP